MHQRRRVLAAAAAAAVSPAVARAQARMPAIGYLSYGSGSDRTLEPLRAALQELGYVEGRSMTLDVRWAAGSPELAARHAAELVSRPVDLIVAWSSPAARAAQSASRTLPILAIVADPLATGLVATLSRPGANLTAVSFIGPELMPKRLELIRGILPGLGRIGFVGLRSSPQTGNIQQEIAWAADRLGIRLAVATIDRFEELERAFAELAREAVGVVAVAPVLTAGAEMSRQTAELAMRHRLAWIAEFRVLAEAGALMSYGPSDAEGARGAAGYIDRILKGARPGELPVLQPTTFELVLNLATARALGITVPPDALARADDVIE